MSPISFRVYDKKKIPIMDPPKADMEEHFKFWRNNPPGQYLTADDKKSIVAPTFLFASGKKFKKDLEDLKKGNCRDNNGNIIFKLTPSGRVKQEVQNIQTFKHENFTINYSL